MTPAHEQCWAVPHYLITCYSHWNCVTCCLTVKFGRWLISCQLVFGGVISLHQKKESCCHNTGRTSKNYLLLLVIRFIWCLYQLLTGRTTTLITLDLNPRITLHSIVHTPCMVRSARSVPLLMSPAVHWANQANQIQSQSWQICEQDTGNSRV